MGKSRLFIESQPEDYATIEIMSQSYAIQANQAISESGLSTALTHRFVFGHGDLSLGYACC